MSPPPKFNGLMLLGIFGYNKFLDISSIHGIFLAVRNFGYKKFLDTRATVEIWHHSPVLITTFSINEIHCICHGPCLNHVITDEELAKDCAPALSLQISKIIASSQASIIVHNVPLLNQWSYLQNIGSERVVFRN